MYIQEAIAQALETHGYFYRKKFPRAKLIPHRRQPISVICDGELFRCWNPQGDDLTADDWLVGSDKTVEHDTV